MNHLSYEELVDKKICPDRIEFPNGRVWKNEQGDKLIRFKSIEFCQVSYVCKPFPKQHALSVCLTYYEDSRKRSKGLIAQCDLTAGFEEDRSEFVTIKEGKLVDAFVYEGEEKKYTRPPIIFGSTSEYKLLPAPFQEQLKPIYDGTRLTMEQIIALQQRDFTAKILVSPLEEIERLRSEGTITPAEAERRWKEHCKKITE